MMNFHQERDREQMRMAILNQEQIFRQQVHEMHRLYHVQKQLMQQAQMTALASRTLPAVIIDVKPRPQKLDIWCGEKATTTTPQQQIISFTSCNMVTTPPPASALAEECNLELTLATGPSSSSSNSSCDAAERRQGKQLKASSNSDCGATTMLSTSMDSKLTQLELEAATPVRFHGEVNRRMDEMGQGPWMYHNLLVS